MMNIIEKIRKIYPSLITETFGPFGEIIFQDDSDGNGPYIAKWEHKTLKQPTKDQLIEKSSLKG